jgi:hypothetical protein
MLKGKTEKHRGRQKNTARQRETEAHSGRLRQTEGTQFETKSSCRDANAEEKGERGGQEGQPRETEGDRGKDEHLSGPAWRVENGTRKWGGEAPGRGCRLLSAGVRVWKLRCGVLTGVCCARAAVCYMLSAVCLLSPAEAVVRAITQDPAGPLRLKPPDAAQGAVPSEQLLDIRRSRELTVRFIVVLFCWYSVGLVFYAFTSSPLPPPRSRQPVTLHPVSLPCVSCHPASACPHLSSAAATVPPQVLCRAAFRGEKPSFHSAL